MRRFFSNPLLFLLRRRAPELSKSDSWSLSYSYCGLSGKCSLFGSASMYSLSRHHIGIRWDEKVNSKSGIMVVQGWLAMEGRKASKANRKSREGERTQNEEVSRAQPQPGVWGER